MGIISQFGELSSMRQEQFCSRLLKTRRNKPIRMWLASTEA